MTALTAMQKVIGYGYNGSTEKKEKNSNHLQLDPGQLSLPSLRGM